MLAVYVAGASGEIDRARGVITTLRERGIETVHDWPAQIDAHGGRANRGLSEEERKAVAIEGYAAASRCNVLLLLVPSVSTCGAWVELGVAKHAGALVLASGATDDVHQSVFTALCDRRFERPRSRTRAQLPSEAQERADDDAIAWLCGYAHACAMREAAE
jgi:hypothetical protein